MPDSATQWISKNNFYPLLFNFLRTKYPVHYGTVRDKNHIELLHAKYSIETLVFLKYEHNIELFIRGGQWTIAILKELTEASGRNAEIRMCFFACTIPEERLKLAEGL